ncbi:MAG: triose-phosphate isomerase [Patescibacteria group bacterium]
MKKNQKIVVGNWKMNPDTLASARTIFLGIKKASAKNKKILTVICPPFLFLTDLASRAGRSEKLSIGAQDVFFENSGAFTGETGPIMLKNAGTEFVIVGHSERRALGDTDYIVSKKVLTAIKAGFSVILCIGEKERDSNATYLAFIKEQVKSCLDKINRPQLKQIIITYEPVWAIGKKEAMSAHDLEQMVIFIRRVLADMYGAETAGSVPILYGGSVTPENTADLITTGKVAGLLVGRESRDPKSFSEILNIVDSL